MPDFSFGDLVTVNNDGVYMVIGPYIGKRGANDPQEAAVWLMDIDTEFSRQGEPAATWCSVAELETVDDG